MAGNEDMIINPASVSEKAILNDYTNWINKKQDKDAWIDRFATSVGQTVLELASGLGALLFYHSLIARREMALSTAQNYTSALSVAWDCGYSAHRGNVLKLRCKILAANANTYTKYQIIGVYGEYSAIFLGVPSVDENGNETYIDAAFNPTDIIEVDIAIGRFIESNPLTIDTEILQIFNFNIEKISEDFMLLLNGTQLQTSTEDRDIINDYWITKTNTYGGIDTFYWQEGDYKYHKGDNLVLRYIEMNNVDYSNFSDTSLTLFDAEEVLSITLKTDMQEPEDISRIKSKVPMSRDLASLIRARDDFKKWIVTKSLNVRSANTYDITAGLIGLAYVKEDESIMSDTEAQEWIASFQEGKPDGTLVCKLLAGSKIDRTITVRIWVKPGFNIPSDLDVFLEQTLSKWEKELAPEIDVKEVENAITQNNAIQIARVEFDKKVWTPETRFYLYDFILPEASLDPNAQQFVLYKVRNFSGIVNPFPDTAAIGERVTDNHLVWERVENMGDTGIQIWTMETHFPLFTYIMNNNEMWQVVDFCASTGEADPFQDGGAIVEDSEIEWTYIENPTDAEQVQAVEWTSFTATKLGTIIVTNEDKYYKATNFIYRSGTDVPEWDNPDAEFVYENRLVWKMRASSTENLKLKWNEYIKFNIQTKLEG